MTTVSRFPLLAIFILVALIARAQTFGSPTIEFDEQFYLLVGDRMLSGALPYVDIWDRKPIGVFLIFAGIRSLGGDGVLAYQLVAALFVGCTALTIHTLTILIGGKRFGATCAAIGYILWLNLLQGEGGQAAVFYNLPVAIAALLVARTLLEPNRTPSLELTGATAMILLGIAIQIKYTVVLEGIAFGIMLLWAAHKRQRSLLRTGGLAILCATVALTPTIAAVAYYAQIGHLGEFMFANFQSLALRGAPPIIAVLTDLFVGIAIIGLPLIAAIVGLRRRTATADAKRFITMWLIVAAISIIAIRTFSPHYFIPLTVPIMVAAGLAFGEYRKLSIALLGVAALAGQGLLAYYDWAKGGRDEARAMVAAIGQVPNCLYVHNGFPSLYLLTNSCLPTRFVFPGLLNTQVEATAIGVNPSAEVKRILANKPDAIVTDLPVFSQGNRAIQALVESALARDYHLVLKLKTGKNRYRLVYRINLPQRVN